MATIACKLPNGLTINHKGISVTLNGANHDRAIAGFGMTNDVDADWFASWAKEMGDFPAIKNGSIYVMQDAQRAEDAAEERADDPAVQTGQEPLDPEKPGSGVEPTDEQKKELAKTAPSRNKRAPQTAGA